MSVMYITCEGVFVCVERENFHDFFFQFKFDLI